MTSSGIALLNFIIFRKKFIELIFELICMFYFSSSFQMMRKDEINNIRRKF